MIETIANKVFINNYISSQNLQILESSAMDPGGTIESPRDLAVKFGAHEATDSGLINGKWHYRLQAQQTLLHKALNCFHT